MKYRSLLQKSQRNVFVHAFSTNAPEVALRPYKFDVGVSWHCSKKKTLQRLPLKCPAAMFRDKALKVPPRLSSFRSPGDDFFFVQQMAGDSGLAVAIADGVGGWRLKGIDPSPFSQSLMYYASQVCQDSWAGVSEEGDQSPRSNLSPVSALELGYEAVLRDRVVPPGSSTACLLTLDSSSGLLRSANLGDSGFVVFRDGVLIHQTKPQVSSSGAPFQLTKLSPAWSAVGPLDSPSLADTNSLVLQDGDIAILYTDGLSDNLHLGEISPIVAKSPREKETREDFAQLLADTLVHLGRDSMYKAPKVAAPHSLSGEYFVGGKPDDITVLAVVVTEQD